MLQFLTPIYLVAISQKEELYGMISRQNHAGIKKTDSKPITQPQEAT
jgi:hypothetical protein